MNERNDRGNYNNVSYGGYGYYSEKMAEENLRNNNDCTERGTYRWYTAKSIAQGEPQWVEVTHVVDTHEKGVKNGGRYIATVIEWVDAGYFGQECA